MASTSSSRRTRRTSGHRAPIDDDDDDQSNDFISAADLMPSAFMPRPPPSPERSQTDHTISTSAPSVPNSTLPAAVGAASPAKLPTTSQRQRQQRRKSNNSTGNSTSNSGDSTTNNTTATTTTTNNNNNNNNNKKKVVAEKKRPPRTTIYKNILTINGDGYQGSNGAHGSDGTILLETNHGGHGQDATNPERGENGKDLFVQLSTTDHNAGVRLYAMATEELLLDDVYQLKRAPTLKWSARGGTGGNGANGGNGCSGLPGLNGVDATKDKPGTNGKDGGNGGNAGSGTSGADGGDGGKVRILIEERDLYLLMLVEPCGYTESLLTGGKSGSKGRHGEAGSAGPGGRGGRALVYEEEVAGEEMSTLPSSTAPRRKSAVAGQSSLSGAGTVATSGSGDNVKETQTIVIKIPGGIDGKDGVKGTTPTDPLVDGKGGDLGTFKIQVVGHEDAEPYQGRYDLELVDWQLQGKSPMAGGECEFGDLLGVHSVVVRNTGKMPTPSSQIIRLLIRDNHDPIVNPLLGDACIPAGTMLPAGETCVSEGELPFFAGYPMEVDDPDDFDPLRHTTHFHLQAYQMGPSNGNKLTSDFSREYKGFHKGEGIPITYRYPVENTDGVVGVQSLFPTEETYVLLKLDNVGLESLGGFDHPDESNQRRVSVRYFVNKAPIYNTTSADALHFGKTKMALAEGGELPAETVSLAGNGKLLDIPTIHPGTSFTFRTKVAFDAAVPFYSRSALQVDILIETLPLPDGVEIVHDATAPKSNLPQMSVIQRRKLELFCEPKYDPQPTNKIVLVTSIATTKDQYENWTKAVFEKSWNVGYETYSVSRYGTLDPNFVLEDGATTLREAFRNKLVVLLTEPFVPDPCLDGESGQPIQPHRMLLHGCMEQSSGFEPSTKWLVVGGNADMHRDLLEGHLSVDEPDERDAEFNDVYAFQKHVQHRVQEESALGRGGEHLPIRQDSILVDLPQGSEAKKLSRVAESLSEWLQQHDPLCQYTVEYEEDAFEEGKKKLMRKRSLGTLRVRRGYCRSQNSVVVVLGKYAMERKSIQSEAMLMSMAEAVSHDMRVTLFCDAIRAGLPQATLTALKYAAVSDLIREQVIFLECRMKMNEDLELSFPTIGSFLDNVDVLSLIRDCKMSIALKTKARQEFSDLLARFELVANSKDLRPRFAVMGRGKKKTTHEAMLGIVDRLRTQWKTVLDNASIEARKKALKEETKAFLKEDTGKKNLNVRADQRWIQGLNYVHSTENEVAFGIANSSKRLIELDVDSEKDNYKISAPSVRVYSSSAMRKVFANQHRRMDRATQIAEAVRSKRAASIL